MCQLFKDDSVNYLQNFEDDLCFCVQKKEQKFYQSIFKKSSLDNQFETIGTSNEFFKEKKNCMPVYALDEARRKLSGEEENPFNSN